MTPAADIPKYAWKRRLDNWPEEPGRPRRYGSGLLSVLDPVSLRTRFAVGRERRAGREHHDIEIAPGPVMGVPLGGLGGGTITPGWQGDFVRFQLQPGHYDYGAVPADAFSLYVQRGSGRGQVRALRAGRPASGALAGWEWTLDPKRATYYALYPRAWTTYTQVEPGINLTCRQVSPFLPGNYRESSLPAGVFVWTIENTGQEAATVGLMFTFQNGTGGPGDRAGGHHNAMFRQEAPGGEVAGVALHHRWRQPKWLAEGQKLEDQEYYEDPLTFAIAAQACAGVEVTARARFATTSSAMDVWGDFREDGRLEDVDDHKPSTPGMAIGAAVAATVEVPAGQTREVAFALAWDMPVARFGAGTGWYRRYTRYYGREGAAAPALARDALTAYPAWEQAIEAWQAPILAQTGLPDWFKAALFNELYYLADGGTIWTDGREGEPPPPEGDIGHFACLEGHEYRMYNTCDVHFYAGWALAAHFPELELSLQRDVAAAVPLEDPERRRLTGTGRMAPRKVRGAVPHDLGGPTEDPWLRLNIYYRQDTATWKDLNPKFVLQVYRGYMLTQNRDFLAGVWPAVQEAMAYAEEGDLDEDGLIENTGPDQTYDTWSMQGPSAYCGGLWLAALSAAAAIADVMGDGGQAAHWRDLLARGRVSYEELLWNDEYYSFDTSGGQRGSVIMAGQLAGHWYARACGLEGIVPADHARSALKKIYDFNVKQFEEGEMGAVNGMLPTGLVETVSEQSQEVWPGITYALAAAMLQEELFDEAWATARGIARMTYDELGYWFATPEAWDAAGDYRSLISMRPLAIWAMQHAWNHLNRRP